MNRYAEYKDSGVEWIGEIPSDWITNRIGRMTYVKGRIGWKGLTSDQFTDQGPFLITGTDFQNGSIEWSSTYHVTQERYDEDPFIIVENDDVLITKDGTIGKVVHITNFTERATLNSGIFITRPLRNIYKQRFFYWILNSRIFTEFIDFTSTGSTIQHLYQNVFENFSLPIPKLHEQTQISKYLDKETSQIDSLIEKIERKIKLLKEQRTALISQCVTKGLDPNAEMKNSGVEWIGEIPSHWEIKKLKRVSEIETGTTPPTINENYYNDGTTPWVKPENLNGMTSIKFTTRKLTELGVEKSRLLRANSVLVCGIGTIGKFGFATKPVCTNQQINGITFFKEIVCSRFGLYLISSMVDEFKRISEKVVVSILTKTRQQNCSIAFPSLNEQFSICQYLDKKTSQIDSLSEKLRRKIELLKEYRQSLISNVVTGKVKVTEDAS